MNKFLIYIAQSYGIPIGIPLQKEIEKRGHQVFWFSELEYTKSYLPKHTPLLNSVEDVLDYNPEIVLTATDVVPDFFPGVKVQIFHGFIANKRAYKKDHFRLRGFFDLYTTQGPSTTKVFKALAKQHQYFDVIETGWSKVDPLFPIISSPPHKKPVVLITSTFTKRLSLAKNDEVCDEINRLSKKGEFKFISVLHPMLDKETKAKFKSFENENFVYHDTTNLIPLFKEADIMLSDTTSAIVEFLLQEKPVVTFKNNKPENYLINITQVDEIETALNKALNPESLLLNNIKEFINITHPYFDGKSSARVIDAVINFFNNDQSHLKRKPLNLMRKWKIRKKLNYLTLKSYNKVQTKSNRKS